MRAERGFTLVEVLVAVTVAALMMAALAMSIGSSAQTYARIEERNRGQMIAADKLVELQVFYQWPAPGVQDSEVERFGQTWQVRVTTAAGPYPDTARVEIEVASPTEMLEDRKVIYSQGALIGKPYP